MDRVVHWLASAWLNPLHELALPGLKVGLCQLHPCRPVCECSPAMPGMNFLQAAEGPAGSKPPKRTRAEGHFSSKSLEQQVQDLEANAEAVTSCGRTLIAASGGSLEHRHVASGS
eukprot:s1616_g17.t1